MMKNLFGEAHRRSLWQVLGIYLAASWVALQVVGEIADSLALPDWVQPLAIILLVIGFPIVLATAFIQKGFAGRREAAPSVPSETATPDLDAESPAVEPAVLPAAQTETARTHHRLFTWKNALLAGAGAGLLLLVAVGGYMATRTLGIGPAATLVAQGVLDERDRIVVADFENRTSDSQLAQVVAEAMRVDLARSEVVRLAEPGLVAAALGRMAQPTDAPLTEDVARELAVREGLGAVVTGEVGAAGSGFVLSAQLVTPNGDILVSERETARNADEVLPAIDELSKKLRERIGESLRTLGGEEPLERVTTADLAALRKYSQAIRAIDVEVDWQRGVALLEEAVAIDTAFAMAYRKLGQELYNRGHNLDRAREALTLAFNHRDRLTERERGLTMASYYGSVTGETEKVIQAYETLLEMNPNDDWALNNIGVSHMEIRDWERAADAYRRAIEIDSSSTFPYTNLSIVLASQGLLDESEQTLQALLRQTPHNRMGEGFLVHLNYLRGAVDSSLILAEHMLEDSRDNPFLTSRIHEYSGGVAATRGQLAESERVSALAEEIQSRSVSDAVALNAALEPVWKDAFVREDSRRAIRRLEAILERYPLSEMPHADRPYLSLIQILTGAGEAARAQAVLEEWEAGLDPATIRTVEHNLEFARGLIAAAESRLDEAIALLRRADFGECLSCVLPYRARTFDRASMPDSAIVTYEAYLEVDHLFRVFTDRGHLGPSLERTAQLYDEKGDLEKAALYYARFVELWAEADEELQPRVRAAQARLEEIVRERG